MKAKYKKGAKTKKICYNLVGDKMVKLDDVLKTIDTNQNLSLEIKENIKHLLTVYATNIENIDFEAINKNIADLKVEESNKYIIKEPLKYVDTDATIYINCSEANKDYDYRFLLMRELMLMQTHKDDITKQKKENFNPIYEGYASICASYLVGNDSTINLYEDEMITVNLLSKIVGKDSIEQLFVNNDTTLLVDNLSKTGNTVNDLKSLIDIMNYNMSARNHERGKSMLSDIQIKLINMFANKNDKNMEDIENFKNNLYGNNLAFDTDADKYKDINKVYNIYDEMVNNLNLNQTIAKTR